MTFPRLLLAELRKLLTLPATFAALAVAVGGSAGITVLNASGVRRALDSGDLSSVGYTSAIEAAYSAVPLGTVGAVVLGVTAMSSEYTANSPDAGGGRQIVTTLTGAPGRAPALLAKAAAVVLLTAAMATAVILACLAVAEGIIAEAGTEPAFGVLDWAPGAALYWVLTALIGLAITVFTRSGIVPLILLIVNSSLVSVSLLLSNVTSLAFYLPDMAGMSLFAQEDWFLADEALPAATGGLVMGGWALGLLVIATIVFSRRDA